MDFISREKELIILPEPSAQAMVVTVKLITTSKATDRSHNLLPLCQLFTHSQLPPLINNYSHSCVIASLPSVARNDGLNKIS